MISILRQANMVSVHRTMSVGEIYSVQCVPHNGKMSAISTSQAMFKLI